MTDVQFQSVPIDSIDVANLHELDESIVGLTEWTLPAGSAKPLTSEDHADIMKASPANE